eukprot:1347248-Amphidinium_carterae.1
MCASCDMHLPRCGSSANAQTATQKAQHFKSAQTTLRAECDPTEPLQREGGKQDVGMRNQPKNWKSRSLPQTNIKVSVAKLMFQPHSGRVPNLAITTLLEKS